MQETTKVKDVQAKDHESYGTYTIIALLIAPVGFILGIVYLTKNEKVDRKLGEHLVAISVLASIVYSIMWYALVPKYAMNVSPRYNAPIINTEPAMDVEEVYGKITEGMTKSEVEAITKRTAGTCGESESGGAKYETCSYGNASSDTGLIVVNYINGRSTTKSKANY